MDNEILSIQEIVPNVYTLVIKAERIARKARPGQFVILMAEESGERIPFTICDWDAEEGTITLNFLEVGVSTCELARKKKGELLYSVAGPLGKEASLPEGKSVLLGGGCYGIGAIYPLARELKKLGNRVTIVVEGRAEYLIYMADKLKTVSDEFHVVTVDNPTGSEAKVKDVVKSLLEKGEPIDCAYFIGCSFMMMKCSEVTKPYNLKSYVYLDALMLDGTGMCGCCRVTVGGKTRFACVHGPEFDGHEVDWEEFAQKKSYYHEEEVRAYHHHGCRNHSHEHHHERRR